MDETWILGDSGSFNDVYRILESLEDVEVKLVAGDEDKDQKEVSGRNFTGWFRQINSSEPFDVDVDYEIFDEGFETEIEGTRIQAAHHPSHDKREDELNWPDTREGFLENLFSVKRYTNENTVKGVTPSLENSDMFIYDHVHMPYARAIEDKFLVGMGGRRYNYQRKDVLPERSLHLSSFDDGHVHELHFDAEHDEIFEHLLFDRGEPQLYSVKVPRTEHNQQTEYFPLQSRFRADQIDQKARERPDQLPPRWESEGDKTSV
ncbi:MAG: hypothetical protein ABEJ75_01525 [Candidatus Nanohaloarchaea archaeon]